MFNGVCFFFVSDDFFSAEAERQALAEKEREMEKEIEKAKALQEEAKKLAEIELPV